VHGAVQDIWPTDDRDEESRYLQAAETIEFRYWTQNDMEAPG
jgi:hypothetical protein